MVAAGLKGICHGASSAALPILALLCIVLLSCSQAEELPGASCAGECSGMTFTRIQMEERFGIINYSACVDCDSSIDGHLYAEAVVQGEEVRLWYDWTSCESPVCGWHACVQGGTHAYDRIKEHLCGSIQERSTSLAGCPQYDSTNETRAACRDGAFERDGMLAIHQQYTRCGSNVTISACDGLA